MGPFSTMLQVSYCLLCLFITSALGDDPKLNRVKRIVGGTPAQEPPEDDPVVFTRFADRTARITGTRDFPHYVFKGIRYGEAPTGKFRFLRPRQHFLEKEVNATKYPPPCLQPLPNENRVIGNEDCLFLNVFTPTLPTGMEGLPVIVWIHGGGFRYGSASQYGVRHLVGKQVVIVTIQYRLGSLGFLSTGSKEMPGNAALWDMVLAVQWVRNYIGFFGGNPHKIVVMGHGSGASSAMMVALSNVAKGKSTGVIAMSGSSVSNSATDNSPKNTALEVANENDCPTGSELTMVRCLQSLPAPSIIRGDSRIEFQRLQERGFVEGLNGKLGSAPVWEGRSDGRSLPSLIENSPMDNLYFHNSHPKMPLLTGITKDETKRACQGTYKKQILTKLQTVPHFLDSVLVKNLQTTLGVGSNLSNIANNSLTNWLTPIDPLQFYNYLKVQKNNLVEGIEKIAEATNDALFNVPAFLTADAWSRFKDTPVFLYRFEHVGKMKKGFNFLRGLPLIGNVSEADNLPDTVSHGDELAYLFDAQDIEGNPLDHSQQNQSDEDDNKVRDLFTQMIADFARYGHVNINNENVKPFSASDNNFIQILPKPKVANNFRFCEMALWCGLAQRLQSSTCSFIKVIDSQVKNIQSLFDVNKSPIKNPLPTFPSLINKNPVKLPQIPNSLPKFTHPFFG